LGTPARQAFHYGVFHFTQVGLFGGYSPRELAGFYTTRGNFSIARGHRDITFTFPPQLPFLFNGVCATTNFAFKLAFNFTTQGSFCTSPRAFVCGHGNIYGPETLSFATQTRGEGISWRTNGGTGNPHLLGVHLLSDEQRALGTTTCQRRIHFALTPLDSREGKTPFFSPRHPFYRGTQRTQPPVSLNLCVGAPSHTATGTYLLSQHGGDFTGRELISCAYTLQTETLHLSYGILCSTKLC